MCPDIPLPDKGRIMYSTGSSANGFGAMATYECNTGFGLTGPNIRTCVDGDGLTTAGTWDGEAPTCERMN